MIVIIFYTGLYRAILAAARCRVGWVWDLETEGGEIETGVKAEGVQAGEDRLKSEGVQAEVIGTPTFSLRPLTPSAYALSLQSESLQPIYLLVPIVRGTVGGHRA